MFKDKSKLSFKYQNVNLFYGFCNLVTKLQRMIECAELHRLEAPFIIIRVQVDLRGEWLSHVVPNGAKFFRILRL